MTNESEQSDWDDIRARYEKGEEPVKAIADTVGLSTFALSMKAKALGWLLRTRRNPDALLRTKRESTQVTLKRLKELLQTRIKALEMEINSITREISELDSERSVRSMNTLVRTLEKVLELERKDRFRRRKAVEKHKRFDDAERDALAVKIEGLQRQWRGTETLPSLDDIRDEWSKSRLDPVGPDRSAAAGTTVPNVADLGGAGGREDKGRS